MITVSWLQSKILSQTIKTEAEIISICEVRFMSSREKVLGYLLAVKSPGTFVTTAGAVKDEKKPLRCVLFLTSKRLIALMTQDTYDGLRHFILETGLEMLPKEISETVEWLKRQVKNRMESRKAEKIEDTESLDEVLKEAEHFEIDYGYIEKLEFQKFLFFSPSLRIRVSWDPRYLDKELEFSVARKHKGEDCVEMLHSALSAELEEEIHHYPFNLSVAFTKPSR